MRARETQAAATHLFTGLGLLGAGTGRGHWLGQETAATEAALPALLSLELRALSADNLEEREQEALAAKHTLLQGQKEPPPICVQGLPPHPGQPESGGLILRQEMGGGPHH